MEYVESVIVSGMSQDKYILLKLGIKNDDSYELNKILHFIDTEKRALHSIFYSDNVVYMVDSFNNKVIKFDFASNSCSDVTVGRDPRHLCLNKDNIYVTNFESDNISVIDNNSFTLAGSIPAGIKPHDIKYYHKDNNLYVSCYEENQIIQLNPHSGETKCLETDGKPMHIFVDDILIAMTYYANGNIYSKINFLNFETNNIEDIIKIKGLASDIEYDYVHKLLYVINIEDKSIYIIDAIKRKIIKKIQLGGYPESLTVGENYLLVTNSKKKLITLIDIETLTIYKNIELEFTPDCIKIIRT
ncbi:MAG: hypothetical protein PHE29_11950 [Tissierellia bacterium]|nr:hypothetical protein [Tissierellia bacterium]MDD4779537.1 hypothetical protein [Tissierellia bacterium]